MESSDDEVVEAKGEHKTEEDEHKSCQREEELSQLKASLAELTQAERKHLATKRAAKGQ